jgi:hypothetical protein
MVDRQHQSLSIIGQCRLLGISRSSLYYRPVGVSSEDLNLMQLLDQQYMATPFYGSRRMKVWLHGQGYPVGPPTGTAPDAHHGIAGHLPAASPQPAGARA